MPSSLKLEITTSTFSWKGRSCTWGWCPLCGTVVTTSKTEAGAVRNVRRHIGRKHRGKGGELR